MILVSAATVRVARTAYKSKNGFYFYSKFQISRHVPFPAFVHQPPRLLTSRLLKVLHYWVHQTLNRFSTPNYTEKTLTPVPNSREGCAMYQPPYRSSSAKYYLPLLNPFHAGNAGP